MQTMTQKEIFREHRFLMALSRKHPNRYVALVGERVLAIGKDQFKVLSEGDKKLKKGESIGLFFLPGKKRSLYLLTHRK